MSYAPGLTAGTDPTAPQPAPAAAAPPAATGAAAGSPSINFGGISGGASTATGAPSVNMGVGSPLVSQDQTSLSQYVIQTIGGYPIVPGALPGVLSSTSTIGGALQDLYQLSPAQLMQLQSMLLQAGFYENADGSVLSDAGAVAFGQADNQTWLAFGRALQNANQQGTSVMSVLQNRIASGIGTAQQTTLPSPVIGGGNTYEIDLTQPGAVNEVTNSIFQAALGRNANSDEISKVLAAVNAGEIAQGGARVQLGETSSEQKYQAQVNQRNIAYQFTKNPKIATGPVPAGPFTDTAQWAAQLLGYMQLPVTAASVAFLVAMSRQMGGSPNNPLGSTNPMAGSTPGPGGVAQYQNASQGLQATAEELLNPKFAGLYDALLTGTPTTYQGVGSAVSVWSNGSLKSVTPNAADNKAGQGAVLVTQQQAPAPAPVAAPPGPPTTWAGGLQSQGPGLLAAPPPPSGPGQTGTAQSLGAEGGGPGVGTPTTPASGVNQGQQPPNPGDAYLNPVVATVGTPLSSEQAAYQAATTGPNRFSFAENNYLHAFLSAVSMIRAGGPTGTGG